MNRTNIYLADEQIEQLDQRARAAGLSRAELIRLLLDERLNGVTDHLDADLAAFEASFGLSAGDSTDDRADGFTIDRSDGARGAHLQRVARR